MDIRSLSIEQYDAFLKQTQMAYNFMQSTEFVRYTSKQDHVKIFGGFQNDELLIATYVILRPALRLFKYGSSPREWIVKTPNLFCDESFIQEFAQGVAKQLKKEHAIVWMVESNTEYQQHDQNGNVVEGSFCNEDYRQMLKRCGFGLSPLWIGYDEARQSRWVSWIDLQKNLPQSSQGFALPLQNGLEEYSWEDLLKEMAGNTRRSFQKTDLPYIVTIRKNGNDDVNLDEFEALLECSAEKHNFGSGAKDHRLNILKSFGDHGYLSTAYLDVEEYDRFLQQKEIEFSTQEAEALAVCEKMPNSKKKRNRLLEIQEQKTHNEKEIVALQQLKQEDSRKMIPLASGIYLETPSEMVYLFGGSDPRLARYMGPYANQKEMIRLALDHKLQRYNFWGISGHFKPEEDGYGVFFFKKNLGATVGEYCGEFYWIINSPIAKFFLKRVRPDLNQA